MNPSPNRSTLTVALLAAVFCLLGVGKVQGQPLNFTFSFVGDPAHSSVDGTVTGELVGLENNASSAPTDIIITSAPAGLELPSLSYDLKSSGWDLAGPGDTITVNNGVITGADYQATLDGGNFFSLDFTASNGPITISGINGLELGGERFVSNAGGISGVTYSIVDAPEPSTWALALIGLIGVALNASARYHRSGKGNPGNK